MLISNAYAQTAAAAAGPMDSVMQFLPIILMFAVLYFLMVRPQMKKAKEHKALLEALSKGDEVVTQGGIVGKVTKVVDDGELEVEIAEGTKVRVVRSGISEVRVKGEPVKE